VKGNDFRVEFVMSVDIKSSLIENERSTHCGNGTMLKETSKEPLQNRCAFPFPLNSLQTGTITYLILLVFCFRIFLFILKDITYNNKRFL
jgi:hypothetical protein